MQNSKLKFNSLFNSNFGIILGLLLGVVSGYSDFPILNQIADTFSQIFINALKLISTPLIFLSIFSTVLGMNNIKEFKFIGKRLIKYTLFTTWIAAAVGLGMLLLINPTEMDYSAAMSSGPINSGIEADLNKGYLSFLINAIPSNFILPFSEHHVIGILFLAIVLSAASLTLPDEQRSTLHHLFSSLNALMMKIASWIVILIPIAIWSFITLLFKDMKAGLEVKRIALYLAVVLSANLIQGLIVLPIFAKLKGVSPLKLATGMLPALLMAFFSKSSSATLPLTMRCAEENAKIPKKLTKLAFPLCTAINMNGCAGFIVVTVLFVSISQGMHFSMLEMLLWTVIATIAAVGNAGVPMGCYFLTSAFLVAMNVPLSTMAIILPFYALLDMVETMLNVWSDACVAAAVDVELKAYAEDPLEPLPEPTAKTLEL